MRLDTLVRLRWLAVLGQIGAVLFVRYGLDFALPLWMCLGVIALYARDQCCAARRVCAARSACRPIVRPGCSRSTSPSWRCCSRSTGGLQNPFAYLFLGPVLISATALPPRMTLMLAGLAIACASVLVFVHYPLPWSSDDPLELPPIYMMGVWLSILLAIGYISIYAWQITEEARQFADALAATELVLAREQHISQLDGLAAAAAHELATPLVDHCRVSRRNWNWRWRKGPHVEDVRILREQALRCREILGKLTELPAPGEPFERMKLSALIEEVVAPHRVFGVGIDVAWPQQPAEPVGARNPAILYGLGNLLENAIDYARERVEVAADWDDSDVAVTDHGRRTRLPGGNHRPYGRALRPGRAACRIRGPWRKRPGWASDSSSRKRYSNARAQRLRLQNRLAAGTWCGCTRGLESGRFRAARALRCRAMRLARWKA